MSDPAYTLPSITWCSIEGGTVVQHQVSLSLMDVKGTIDALAIIPRYDATGVNVNARIMGIMCEVLATAFPERDPDAEVHP